MPGKRRLRSIRQVEDQTRCAQVPTLSKHGFWRRRMQPKKKSKQKQPQQHKINHKVTLYLSPKIESFFLVPRPCGCLEMCARCHGTFSIFAGRRQVRGVLGWLKTEAYDMGRSAVAKPLLLNKEIAVCFTGEGRKKLKSQMPSA
jgi:hypothetical protein